MHNDKFQVKWDKNRSATLFVVFFCLFLFANAAALSVGQAVHRDIKENSCCYIEQVTQK